MLSFSQHGVRADRNLLLARSRCRDHSDCVPSQLDRLANTRQSPTYYYWSAVTDRKRYPSPGLVSFPLHQGSLLHALVRQCIPLLPDFGLNLRPRNRHPILHLVQTANCRRCHHARVSSPNSEPVHSSLCFDSCRPGYFDVFNCSLLLLHPLSR